MLKWTLSAIGIGIMASPLAAATYNGNGASGFGGPLGNGSLTITDTPTGLTFSLSTPGDLGSNGVAVYLDTVSGGFADTGSFSDDSDGGRTIVSGFEDPGRSTVTFASGFEADYALAIEGGFLSVFDLNAGGDDAHTWLFGTGQSGSPYSITLSTAQMAQIGLTADSGQSFQFVATLISNTGFRSNEAIGTMTPNDANPGFDGDVTFSDALTYTLVPEPASLSLIGLGALALLRRRTA